MTTKEKWACWELSREDIARTARSVGVDPGKLTAQDYENIAKKLEEKLKKVNKYQWEIILEDEIERMLG
jgi:hypothetical protein